jgi:Maf-like protein
VSASLVLASCSPRRAALLSEAGFEFESVSPRVAEKFDIDLTLRELTMWNAIRKGVPVARAYPDKIVLAADTLIALDDEIIGKPADFEQAAQILRRLSGRRLLHQRCGPSNAENGRGTSPIWYSTKIGLTRQSSATAGAGERGKQRQLFHKIKSGHRGGQRLAASPG